MIQRLRSVLCVFVMLTLLIAASPPRAAKAVTPLSEAEAVNLLVAYAIVRGDPHLGLNLGATLTRAQAAALFVRVMGAEEFAKLVANLVPYSDAQGHWAAGEITMATHLGLMQGVGDGLFRPDSTITYAEVLTVLLRMVGQEPAGLWDRTRIMLAAAHLGLVPVGAQADTPALRGKIFWALATAISQIPLADGETILRKHVDRTPPTVMVDRSSIITTDRSVTITGTAQEASRVTVNGQTATFNPGAGRFTFTADLALGVNTLRVEATDLAGNIATAVVTAERRAIVSRIEITGPAMVRAGSATRLTVAAVGPQGGAVPLEHLQVELTGDVATFNLASTTLTAGSKTGRGVLTLRAGNVSKSYTFDVGSTSPLGTQLQISSINDGRALATGKDVTVRVHVLDVHGRLVTDDFFRTISLSHSGLAGVTITPATATTEKGVATFTIRGATEGQTTLYASSGGLAAVSAPVAFLSGTRVVLSASPITLQPDGTTVATIRATLQDENGRTIANNTAFDIRVALQVANTDGVLTNALLTIRRGTATSQGMDGTFRAGIYPSIATITGHVISEQYYSVQSLTLPITAALLGVKLEIIYPTARQTPGSLANVTVRVLDAQNRLVTTGSYAFQLMVGTSNGEPVSAGLPEGVQLTFPNSSLRPVAGAGADAVVGRTHQGSATLQLRYDKSGIVTLSPLLLGPTQTAYHPTTGYGAASASSSMTSQPVQVTFAGPTAGVRLTATSSLGTNQPGGAVTGVRTLTINAQVVDTSGTPIPGYADLITLTRTNVGGGVSSISGGDRKAAVNGTADFTIVTTGVPGFDLYTASVAGFTSPGITIAVRGALAERPVITAIRGIQEGNLSPVAGFVGPNADYMDIQLLPQQPPHSAEPHYWVTAKVFRKGESTPFFISPAINLKSDLPVIRIPKTALRTGRATYEVTINNGMGDTPRSVDLGLSDSINATYNDSYRLNSALFDAETGRLVLATNGLPSNGAVALDRLSLVQGNSALSLGDPRVTLAELSASSVTLQLGALAPSVTPDTFHGAVTVQADDGWFSSADASQVARATSIAVVKPMGAITHATLDAQAQRLHLHGVGFTQGTLALNLIRLQQGAQSVALNPGTATTTDRTLSTTDTQITIGLSTATFQGIQALQGSDVHLVADAGWLRVVSGGLTYKSAALEGAHRLLYVWASINSGQYSPSSKTLTIRGTGFAGASILPEKIAFRAAGTTTDWRPNQASVAVVVNDSTFTITLSAADATAFNTRFQGRSLFLNTEAGWLVDTQGRLAAAIPTNYVLFTVPAE